MNKQKFGWLPSYVRGLLKQYVVQQRHVKSMRARPNQFRSLQKLERVFREERDKTVDRPIFLLSAGWRSGSTLLQRLVCSDPRCIIWGEPYQESCMVQLMAERLLVAGENLEQIKRWSIAGYGNSSLQGSWIANLYPEVKHLYQAHLSFFRSLWDVPASNRGFSIWGIKEVRLGSLHARYLQLLFPHARFVFLVRNPYDAWESYRRVRSWYWQWPQAPVSSARSFGKIWNRQVTGFLDCCEELNGLFVKYEDLSESERELDQIAEYLQIDIDKQVLTTRIAGELGTKTAIPRAERIWIYKEAGNLAKSLGY